MELQKSSWYVECEVIEQHFSLPLCCVGFLLTRYVPQKAKQHNPWYGSSFFHAQAALIDARMIYVHVAVGYRGLYLFYVQDEEVGGRGGTRAVLEEPSPRCPQVLPLLFRIVYGIVVPSGL